MDGRRLAQARGSKRRRKGALHTPIRDRRGGSVWVKAGALFSLDWDYRDLGAQCGEMALQVLHGVPPGSIPAAVPRKVLYSVNRNTAQQMKITIPGQFLQGARNVF